MASELHPWPTDSTELEFLFSSHRLPCGHVFEAKLDAQQGAIREAFFFLEMFEQSTSWCIGSHFFVARSHRFIATCHCRFLASFLKGKAWKENSFVIFFTATNCSTLARHALKLICQTTFDSILFKSCGSVVLLWRHGGHVTETRDFQLQTTQLLEPSCLFPFKSILLRTSGKCQCVKRAACMLDFIYKVQCKWYLRLRISVMGPFNTSIVLAAVHGLLGLPDRCGRSNLHSLAPLSSSLISIHASVDVKQKLC